ncbi:NIPSNAP family protein [Rathayibacter soli]|nr:NIPSNAP family protein [Glaciibacter superstes]
MDYELRTYTVAEGKMNDLLRRFREHTMVLFESHRMTSIGYWTAASDHSK